MKTRRNIIRLTDELPQTNMTTYLLQALDFVVPGEWNNTNGFASSVQQITGNGSSAYVQAVGQKVLDLYENPDMGYQKAMWIYQAVDNTDAILAAAALAEKASGRFQILSFLSRLTPHADTAQSIDLALKLGAEIAAYSLIRGVKPDNLAGFVDSVQDYAGESKMRLAALVCVDGLLPLGPDFMRESMKRLGNIRSSDLTRNATFRQIKDLLPGGSDLGQLRFLQDSLDAMKEWVDGFVGERDLSRDSVLGNVRDMVEVSDDKLDYVGAFLDVATNYYEHTGTQTVAREIIQHAAS